MSTLFLRLLNISVAASFIVLAAVLFRVFLRKAPKWTRVILWAILAVRLIMPFNIESDFSVIPETTSVTRESIAAVTRQRESVPAASDAASVAQSVQTDTARQAGSPAHTFTPAGDPVQSAPATSDPAPAASDPAPATSDPAPAASDPVPARTAPAAETKTPESAADKLLSAASVLWICGVAAMLAYALWGYISISLKTRESLRVSGRVFICDRVPAPFILGLFRPKIYIPSSLSESDVRFVIAHENAHLARRDHIWKPLGFVLLAVYWFNPAMWLAYILLCRDIEFACDERVLSRANAETRKRYSEALLNCSAPRAVFSACPLAFAETGVKGRIKNALSFKKPAVWIIVVALVASAIAVPLLLTSPKKGGGESESESGDEAPGAVPDELKRHDTFDPLADAALFAFDKTVFTTVDGARSSDEIREERYRSGTFISQTPTSLYIDGGECCRYSFANRIFSTSYSVGTVEKEELNGSRFLKRLEKSEGKWSGDLSPAAFSENAESVYLITGGVYETGEDAGDLVPPKPLMHLIRFTDGRTFLAYSCADGVRSIDECFAARFEPNSGRLTEYNAALIPAPETVLTGAGGGYPYYSYDTGLSYRQYHIIDGVLYESDDWGGIVEKGRPEPISADLSEISALISADSAETLAFTLLGGEPGGSSENIAQAVGARFDEIRKNAVEAYKIAPEYDKDLQKTEYRFFVKCGNGETYVFIGYKYDFPAYAHEAFIRVGARLRVLNTNGMGIKTGAGKRLPQRLEQKGELVPDSFSRHYPYSIESSEIANVIMPSNLVKYLGIEASELSRIFAEYRALSASEKVKKNIYSYLIEKQPRITRELLEYENIRFRDSVAGLTEAQLDALYSHKGDDYVMRALKLDTAYYYDGMLYTVYELSCLSAEKVDEMREKGGLDAFLETASKILEDVEKESADKAACEKLKALIDGLKSGDQPAVYSGLETPLLHDFRFDDSARVMTFVDETGGEFKRMTVTFAEDFAISSVDSDSPRDAERSSVYSGKFGYVCVKGTASPGDDPPFTAISVMRPMAYYSETAYHWTSVSFEFDDSNRLTGAVLTDGSPYFDRLEFYEEYGLEYFTRDDGTECFSAVRTNFTGNVPVYGLAEFPYVPLSRSRDFVCLKSENGFTVDGAEYKPIALNKPEYKMYSTYMQYYFIASELAGYAEDHYSSGGGQGELQVLAPANTEGFRVDGPHRTISFVRPGAADSSLVTVYFGDSGISGEHFRTSDPAGGETTAYFKYDSVLDDSGRLVGLTSTSRRDRDYVTTFGFEYGADGKVARCSVRRDVYDDASSDAAPVESEEKTFEISCNGERMTVSDGTSEFFGLYRGAPVLMSGEKDHVASEDGAHLYCGATVFDKITVSEEEYGMYANYMLLDFAREISAAFERGYYWDGQV